MADEQQVDTLGRLHPALLGAYEALQSDICCNISIKKGLLGENCCSLTVLNVELAELVGGLVVILTNHSVKHPKFSL